MSKLMFAAASGIAATIAISTPLSAKNVRELVMTPGKGVSFYMGSKHGITTFLSEGGTCKLTLAFGDNPDMSGMNPTTSSKLVTTVVEGHPTSIETTEGKMLVFTCNPGAQSMTLVMPPDAKADQ